MLPKLLTAITFSVGACLLSMTTTANTITLAGYPGSAVPDIDCTPSCEGFVGAITVGSALSITDASAYSVVWTESQQLAALNELLSQLDSTRTPATYVDKTIGLASSLTTNRQYFSLYKWNGSGRLWFFENTSGGELIVTALGPDWAHSTEYGAVSAVPVPATAWLFGSALLGMLAVVRRKKILIGAV
jgi:hypothetical protein